jgi:hypothetical protein
VNTNNSYKALTDSWRIGNENARYPRLSDGLDSNNGKNSTFWMENSSYLLLRNLTFAYTLKEQNILERLGVESLRFFVTGTNILTISNIDIMDPEQGSNPGPGYPVMKTYSAGINISL